MSNELLFQPDPNELRRVRAEVREMAAQLGAEERASDTAALVVDELVNNAIEHGAVYRQHGHELAVRMRKDGQALVIEFHDPEMPDDAVDELAIGVGSATDAPALENERGRGLFLLSIYLERLQVERDKKGGLCLRGTIAAA